MKLPFLDNKPKIEYFLSLILRDDKINAFILEKDSEVIKIVNSQEETFSDSLDKTNFEELLDAADKVVSQAENELDLPKEVQRTIFGLKESWVKDGKMKPEHLQILKKLSDSLGLVPIGFLTISEAVVSFLQKEEGAPPSAIFIDVGKNIVTVSSVRAGKVIEVKTAEIHQTPVFTVDTLLKHFEVVEILPAKVVLLNEDEELVQEFISHQWSKSLPFLHLPQIISLQSDSIGKAYAIGLANQTGAKVIDEFAAEPEPQVIEQKEKVKIESEPAQEPAEKIESNVEYVSASDFFGFTNKDVAQTPPPKTEVENVEPAVFEEVPEEAAMSETQKQLLPAQILVVLPKIKKFLFGLFERIKGLNLPSRIPARDRRLIYIALPLLLILFLIAYYLFFLKANVKIFINPKVAQKSQDIIFSTTASDFKKDTIKADFVQASEDGTGTVPATGKKETGDKAKGTVNVFNFSNNKVTLPAKSKLTSSNNLGFLTTTDITIASRSADLPGKTSANVEAEKFGTEYNLPSSTSFTSSNSDISAKNDNPFSGGTKKEIQVISKDDVAKVQEDLIKNLENKAKSDIKEKLDPSKDLLPNFIDESLDKKSLDKDVDQEAKNVILTGTVSFKSLSYDRNEFFKFLKMVFGENQSIDKNNLELSFDDLKKISENDVSAKMDVKVKIIPAIDEIGLAKNISGKSFDKAKSEILKVPQIGDVSIKFSPNFGFLPKILPRFYKNIKIVILEND